MLYSVICVPGNLTAALSGYQFDGEVVSSTTDFIVSLVLTYYIVNAKEFEQ